MELIIGIIVIYASVLILLFIFQRSLMYHPQENNYFGDKLEVEIEKVKIKTSDDIDLLGWFHKKDLKNFKTIIYFHGNAGNLKNRIYKLNHFKDMDVNFLIIAWRGFSGNSGKPTEKGLYNDAKSAIIWLKKLGLTEKDIVIYGESLGSGVATEIAQNSNFAGLVLETPFTSMIDAAKNFYPYIPVLVMHGEADQIVPFWMGKRIFEIANEPKYSYFTKFDDHMMEYDEKLVLALKVFFKSLN